MRRHFRILTILCMLLPVVCFSQEKGGLRHDMPSRTNAPTPDCVREDSVGNLSANNIRLYDSLKAKSRRHAVPRLLYDLLITHSSNDTLAEGRVVDEGRLFEPYRGLRIGEIDIERREVFRKGGNRLERAGNKVHVTTRERVIRRDLLFRSGDPLDPQLLVYNQQLLRSRPYISDAWVILAPDSLDSTRVNITVRTRDSWTISADLRVGSEEMTMLNLYDANILGTGNRLSVKTNFNYRTFDYGGNIIAYEMPNVLGTFFRGEFSAGRDFHNSEFKATLYKAFIRPTDYEAGFALNDIRSKVYMIETDTSLLSRARSLNLWVGRSLYISPLRTSIFVTGHYTRARYPLRPEVRASHNPAFHNTDNLLFGLGLYREKFYTANMVYGFGTREYIATGYKAEVTGGYDWGEFSERMYLGLGVKAGRFTRIGYVMGSFGLGSYIDLMGGSWHHSAIDINLRWFSNLIAMRRTRVRQFLSLNHTQGWNRGSGNPEMLRFTSDNGPRVLSEYVTGINRMVLNTETVFFTPYQPWGFHIAFFGFVDAGLLGRENNPFRNEFFASCGAGIRIKNERLIFSEIQIQLGIAFGKAGWLNSRYFRISNQPHLEEFRYLPSRPEPIEFQ